MSTAGAIIGTGVAALVAATGVVYAPDLVDAATGMTTGAGLATETAVLGRAIATEATPPSTLTCLPDAVDPVALPCERFAEYDFVPATGEYTYTLAWTGGDLTLTGTSTDGQRVVFDSATGGLTDLSGTRLPQDTDLADLAPTSGSPEDQAGLDALVEWAGGVLP